MTQTPKIHIWVPDYESATGGIQVFSRFLVRAVADCFPDGQITVLSKNDSSFPILPTHKSPIRFDCTGWWAPSRRTAAYTSQLIKYGLRDRPDLIFCGHVNFSPVARWLKRIAGIPFVAIGHGLDVWNIRRGGVRHAVSVADRALAVSRFTADSMTKVFGLRSDQIGLLPNTFDPETFVPGPKPHYLLKRFRLSSEQPVILTVTRLAGEEQYKGYDQVLGALPAVRRAVPRVHYILGGKGTDTPRIEALIRALRLDDVVTLAGYIPDHELCGFYNLCDVFAMPSKAEGFGIVFLEALACGKPVIAGNQDGSVDAVINGKVGVLVDPDNVAEIADALTLVLTKRHPLGILQKPERLRGEVIAAYGYARFVQILAAHLARLGFSPQGVRYQATGLVSAGRREAWHPAATKLGDRKPRRSQSRYFPSMILRVALVTHGYQIGGGVSTMTNFLYRVLRESGRFQPEIISLAHSASDSASVRLRSPATWRRGIQFVRGKRNGVAFVHFGAWFSELEFQRYRPRANLTEMLNGYDLVQFVVGTPPWMWAAVRVHRPKFLWTATMTRSDRASRIQKAPPLRRWWLRAMTPLTEQYERCALRIASEVFALSNYTLAGVRAVLGNGSGMLATCGVDTDIFHPAPTQPKKFILCVGRLDDPRKNIALLVEAYARLRRNVPNAPELWLVGQQPLPEVMRLIREHGLTETVRLQGPRNHAELPRIYQSALCFVLSSDEEGLGIVLLEAMACGLPVVSTACGGPETAIEHDRTGFLVPVGDAKALCDAMARLVASPSLCDRLGQEARKVSLERFSVGKTARVFLEKYERALSAAHRFNDG